MKPSILFLLLLFAFGCDEQINQPGPSDPYQLWLSRNIHNYSIEQCNICYCFDGGVKMKVTVRADTVYQVMRLSDSTQILKEQAKHYRSVIDLFSIILKNKTDSLVIQYNGVYGYPDKLDINPQQHPVDGGVLIETSNLKVE